MPGRRRYHHTGQAHQRGNQLVVAVRAWRGRLSRYSSAMVLRLRLCCQLFCELLVVHLAPVILATCVVKTPGVMVFSISFSPPTAFPLFNISSTYKMLLVSSQQQRTGPQWHCRRRLAHFRRHKRGLDHIRQHWRDGHRRPECGLGYCTQCYDCGYSGRY